MTKDKRARAVGTVRGDDIDPYTALRWVGTMFKVAAVFLAVAVAGEFIAGVQLEGSGAVPTLMGQLARTAVLAIVLWGGGDLVRLLVQLGNDVRAERILLARLVHRTPPRPLSHDAEEADDETAIESEAGDDDPSDAAVAAAMRGPRMDGDGREADRKTA